jgi:hypothetical protein
MIHAVYVEIAGRKVGYLASHIAHHYLKRLESLGYSGSAKCAAVIVGGWCRGDSDEGSFGVKLDMTWPVSVN